MCSLSVKKEEVQFCSIIYRKIAWKYKLMATAANTIKSVKEEEKGEQQEPIMWHHYASSNLHSTIISIQWSFQIQVNWDNDFTRKSIKTLEITTSLPDFFSGLFIERPLQFYRMSRNLNNLN